MPCGKPQRLASQTPRTSLPFPFPARLARSVLPSQRTSRLFDLHHPQPEMLLEGFEIAVVVQQGKAALDAEGGDQAIYGGANGDALLAQVPIVGGCQNREGFVSQYRAG